MRLFPSKAVPRRALNLEASVPDGVDPRRLALGVQQPWAELILRGVKTVEIRSQPTNIRGVIYLYASKRVSSHPAAGVAARHYDLEVNGLPRGVLVGTVQIDGSRLCRRSDAAAGCVTSDVLTDSFAWELSGARRLNPPLAVWFLPYGVWFYPFQRRPKDGRGGLRGHSRR